MIFFHRKISYLFYSNEFKLVYENVMKRNREQITENFLLTRKNIFCFFS